MRVTNTVVVYVLRFTGPPVPITARMRSTPQRPTRHAVTTGLLCKAGSGSKRGSKGGLKGV
eukprot:5781753-Pyramimonas_sp.AAC.2